jgi:hypothetical protein
VEAMILRVGWPQTSSVLDDRARRHREENQNNEDRGGHKKPTKREKGDGP